jgi:6-phosphogluconolactonase
VFDDADAAAQAAADVFTAAAADAVASRGRFMLALSGGSTPKGLYRILAERADDPENAGGWSWTDVHVFWGDERAVVPDQPESNYRMAGDSLLNRVPIPSTQIHRIQGEVSDPHEAAARYEDTLRAAFQSPDPAVPVFDLVLLGIGTDGHTASLFPGTAFVDERRRLVVAGWVPQVRAWRITLTLPVLTAARLVVFLVCGQDKADVVSSILGASAAPATVLPARRVVMEAPSVQLILDRAAATRLSQ